MTLEVTVTTTSGDYGDELPIHTLLPWKPTTGVPNVPLGIAVLMHAKELPGARDPTTTGASTWATPRDRAPASSTPRARAPGSCRTSRACTR